MKAAALILFVLSLCAAEVVEIGELTQDEGIRISACHDGDRAMIEIVPSNPGPQRHGGMFTTTNKLLTLKEPAMSMVPSGTNVARIQIVCQGSTSDVREVQFVIRRPVPAPRVGRGRKVEVGPAPPIPPGLYVPLGNSTNYAGYEEFRKRLESGRRRNQ